jgi:hypothetical protein
MLGIRSPSDKNGVRSRSLPNLALRWLPHRSQSNLRTLPPCN